MGSSCLDIEAADIASLYEPQKSSRSLFFFRNIEGVKYVVLKTKIIFLDRRMVPQLFWKSHQHDPAMARRKSHGGGFGAALPSLLEPGSLCPVMTATVYWRMAGVVSFNPGATAGRRSLSTAYHMDRHYRDLSSLSPSLATAWGSIHFRKLN